MAFGIMNLFEETEEVLTELDEGSELAAVDFANRILSVSPSRSATQSYTVYQDDAVIRYAQWLLTCNKELGINCCIDGLHQYAGRFWYADTPTLTETDVAAVFQLADALFSYSQKVLCTHPVDILLIDAQHECLNGENSAVFTTGGMQGCICIYRMQSAEINPIHVLLHELGHLLHIKMTGAVIDIPASFRRYLSRLGIGHKKLTISQLQELFADTFLLAAISQTIELGDPFPDISQQRKQACYEYIKCCFNELS